MPPPPRVGSVLREAAGDFFYNSWRFFGANLLLGLFMVVVVLGSVGSAWALLGVILLVPPAAGTMRMATRLIRDGHTDFSDFTEVLRRPWPFLAVGAAQLVVTLVLVVDVSIAAAWRSWPGTFLVVSAAYGLLLLWAYALVAWPLLLDPVRDAERVSSRLRLAFVVLLAHPLRIGLFALLMGALLVVATVAIAPIITFAVALAWLAIARYVLPIADRVEGRETLVVDD
ncbi:MAG TPA: hypothetical protein VMP86_03460 [Candidatus Binatia bacterium]|nr:hypothetical protein [Candidatus Binatia bacterium]